MTARLDTTLQKYEKDGGDAKFIKEVTKMKTRVNMSNEFATETDITFMRSMQ